MENIKHNNLESLLEILLEQTEAIEKCVLNEESDPEDWNQLIDSRQKIMDQISSWIERGYIIQSDLQEKYIIKAHQINEKLLPIMEQKKNAISEKMGSITSTKNTVKKYNHYSNIAYFSSFFDQKK